ncbi:hypothetical protein G4Y79_23885 [Phototrophicus methaneseepsis]|uniref:Uncharacterized protein n=1 Tax=Phototrophicus methaneseepsis TaxID=2710758 RepID=A0A7S8E9E0_9CHLR|nr:hypothetical protein [Phototrophicus methaneseepsis]QPC82688.1 hypothetical protein G4Y79_23885 [Phototrophicus methaneseepsis]
MVTLKRIVPRSAFRVGFGIGAVLMFIQIAVYTLFMLVIVNIPPHAFGIDFIVRTVMNIFISGLSMGVTAWIAVIIYNWVAKRRGGLQFELDYSDFETKRKNDEFPDDGTTTV